MGVNIIFFTPKVIRNKYNEYANIIKTRLTMIKKLENKNIGINITDMARTPHHTKDIIDIYLDAGVDPSTITTHVSAECRDKGGTRNLLCFLKDRGINNILCVSGDMTGVNVVNNYNVYDLIEMTKRDFKIALSAYPENNRVENYINSRNINYSAVSQEFIINKKFKMLAESEQTNCNIFLQHSYSQESVKNMVNLIDCTGKKYNLHTNTIPSVLPLFSPKYVLNVSGDRPVNNNLVHIPSKYLDLINIAKCAEEKNMFNTSKALNNILLDESVMIANDFREISGGNVAIYDTNQLELMNKLIDYISLRS